MPILSRRAAVAAALSAASGNWVSGQMLAVELGITRVAVGKHVSGLRDLGYRIEASPNLGYRLAAAPDACIPEEVAWRLAHPLWTECRGGTTVGSTNDIVKDLAREGAPEGTLAVASAQSAGRGRLGRAWRSPAGGIYASFLLRPQLPPAAIAPMSLAVGVGVARALETLGVPVGLKWPNDVHAAGRKLGGILLEMVAEADRVEWVVAGFGINVRDPGEPGSAWLTEFVHLPVAEVAARALDSVAASCEQFVALGFASMRGEYESRLTIMADEVTVRDGVGNEVAAGVVRGVDEGGALLVEASEGLRHVNGGEVTLRR